MEEKKFEMRVKELFQKSEAKQLLREIAERPESLEAMQESLRKQSEDRVSINISRIKAMLHALEVLEIIAKEYGGVESEILAEAGLGNLTIEIPVLDSQEFSMLQEAAKDANDVLIAPLKSQKIRILLTFYDVFEYQDYSSEE